MVTCGDRDAFEKLTGGVPVTDQCGPERHGLRRGGRRATGRGCVTAAGRAAAARDEAAAAFAAAASGRRASASAVAGAEASVTRRREGGGELLLFTFGSQHHQMVRAQERTSHDTPSRFSSHVQSCKGLGAVGYTPILPMGKQTQGEENFPRPPLIAPRVQQTFEP